MKLSLRGKRKKTSGSWRELLGHILSCAHPSLHKQRRTLLLYIFICRELSMKIGSVLLLSLCVAVGLAFDCFQTTTGTDAGDCNVGSPCLTFDYTLLNAPTRCDRIFVASGTYSGASNRGFNLIDFLPREIIGDAPGGVIIDLEGQDRFVLENRAATVIGNTAAGATNFTFRLENLVFRNGRGEWAGGAVAIVIQGTSDGLLAAQAGVIDSCSFIDNNCYAFNAASIAETTIGGGAVVLNSLDYNITNTVFENNYVNCTNPDTIAIAYQCGGGAVRASRDTTAPNNFFITDCLFENNSVIHAVQGGIAVGGAFSTTPRTNAASNDHYSQITMLRTRFFNNSVLRSFTSDSGGISTRGGAISLLSSNLFVNCSSTGNPDDCAFGFNRVIGPITDVSSSQFGGGAVGNEFATIVGPFSEFIHFDTVNFYGNLVRNIRTGVTVPRDGGGAINTVRMSLSNCYFCNNTVEGESVLGEAILMAPLSGVTNILNVGPEHVVFQCPSDNATVIAPSAFICNDPLCEYPTPQVDPVTGVCTSCVAPFAV